MGTEKSKYSTLKSKLRKLRKGVRCFVIKNIDINNKDSLVGFIVWFVLRYIPSFLPRPILKLVNKIRDNVSSSWHKSIPEYPLYILAIIAGFFLGSCYLWLFGEKYGHGSSFMTGWLTLSAAPLVLIMWKWRNTHKNSEIKIQHRNANEVLLLKASEQLGHDNEVMRLCGIEAIDRYARLMMDREEPDYREFQRAVSILCAFVRQRNSKCGRENMTRNVLTDGLFEKKSLLEYLTDYRFCVDRIFILMRDYYDQLMDCCLMTCRLNGILVVESSILSFPVVDLNRCDLKSFEFHDKCFLVNANFMGTDLTGSNFTCTDFSYSDFEYAVLNRVDFTRSIINHALFDSTTCIEAKFNGSEIQFTRFKYSNLTNAKFNYTRLANSEFRVAKLFGTTFKRADMSFVKLYGAKANIASFDEAKMDMVELNEAGNVNYEQLLAADSIHGMHSKLTRKRILAQHTTYH